MWKRSRLPHYINWNSRTVKQFQEMQEEMATGFDPGSSALSSALTGVNADGERVARVQHILRELRVVGRARGSRGHRRRRRGRNPNQNHMVHMYLNKLNENSVIDYICAHTPLGGGSLLNIKIHKFRIEFI